MLRCEITFPWDPLPPSHTSTHFGQSPPLPPSSVRSYLDGPHAKVKVLIADNNQAVDTVIFTNDSVVRGSKSGWAFTARVDGVVEAEESDATDPTLSSMQTEINAITFALSWVKHQDYRSILIVTDSLSTLEKVRGSNLHADWTTHFRDSQTQKINWIYCPGHSGVVGGGILWIECKKMHNTHSHPRGTNYKIYKSPCS